MIAFLMLSEGMLTALAATMAVRRRGFISGSPPWRAAIMISLMMRVNAFPRLASRAAFLCLMVAHFECPDIVKPLARMGVVDKTKDITRRPTLRQLLGWLSMRV